MSDPIGYSPGDFFYVSALANTANEQLDFDLCEDPIFMSKENIDKCDADLKTGNTEFYHPYSAEESDAYIQQKIQSINKLEQSIMTENEDATVSGNLTATAENILGATGRNCLQVSLCKNKKLADEWVKLKTNHSSSETRYKDTTITWYVTLLNTFNLSAGILLVSYYLYK